uniref:Tetraspanin n=1 Tax=Astyanax mexicanus TaxID=7994 RepID=A0A3B1ITI1_ASTMX
MSCFGFLKALMFVFNGVIFLAGAGILAVGIWVKVDSGSILNFLQNLNNAPGELKQVLNVGYLLIALGSVLMVMGFLGCCGAVRESRCMLLLFFVILLIVFIAEVAGAIVLLVFKGVVQQLITEVGVIIVNSIKKDYGKNPDITGLLNTTMNTLKCCGFNNYTDFRNSTFSNNGTTYPPYCCNVTICNEGNAIIAKVPGCFLALVSLVNSNASIIVGVALGIAALELTAMTISMIMYCKIKGK